MKKRYLYAFLFGVPGLVIALVTTFFFAGGIAGIFWLFIFGDNEWPSIVGTIIPVLMIVVFLALWITIIVIGYRTGEKLEKDSDFNKKHILISVTLTIVPITCFALYQLNVGNIGPKSDSLMCYEHCVENGYTTFGTPIDEAGKQSCSCFDGGEEVLNVPFDSIDPGK